MSIDSEKREIKNIQIGSKNAKLALAKNYELVDFFIIQLPIDSNKLIKDKKVSSTTFTGYIKKNNPIDEVVVFINSLDLAVIQK